MALSADPVSTLYDEFKDLIQILDVGGEASARSLVDGNFRKVLLLAAASYFEREMTDAVREFTRAVAGDEHVLVALVVGSVIERRYHTWFNWNAANANHFLSMFGARFAQRMKDVIGRDEELSEAVRAFLEIGRERNRVVHQDFVSFRMEKTSDEIYETYVRARRSVVWFREILPQHR